MTQSYVRSAGALPRPANFRKQLAKMNAFNNQGRFDLIEGEREFKMPPEITRVILHSPAGQAFREEHQALGAIGLYVPFSDFSGWAVGLPLPKLSPPMRRPLSRKTT